MSPAGPGDGLNLDLGPNLGTENVREIKEGTGEELEVGRTTGRGIGIRGRGTRTGRIGVEVTEKVALAGAQEVVTVPCWKGWVPDPFRLAHLEQTIKHLKSQFIGFYLYLDLVVHASLISVSVLVSSSPVLPLDPIYLRLYGTHLQDLYIRTSSHLIIYLRCSVSVSVISSSLMSVSRVSSLWCLNPWIPLVSCQLYRYRCMIVYGCVVVVSVLY